MKTLQVLGATAIAAAVSLGSLPSYSQQSSKSTQQSEKSETHSATYSQPMRRLLEAAQRLRDSAHAMAGAKEGKVNAEAIRQVNKALLETQLAMIDLPPELRTTDDPPVVEKKSMERLLQAAQKLREATQALAAEDAGEGRNKAIEQANEALFETQQAMIDLMPETTGSR